MSAAPECVLSAEAIGARVRQIGTAIRRRFAGRPVTILGILNGAAMFAADLSRAVGETAELSFVRARSYGSGTDSSGRVELGAFEREVIDGAEVIMADTILDTGRTLAAVVAASRRCGAAAVASCVLLDKPARRFEAVVPDWAGFVVPDRFYVGYGLDLAGRYRGLPYVGALAREAHA